MTKEIDEALALVRAEVIAAKAKWPVFNSQHEGFAVLAEEFDEVKEQYGNLWIAVKTNQKRRDLEGTKIVAQKLASEAVQVAAMAIRFMNEVCDEERGRK